MEPVYHGAICVLMYSSVNISKFFQVNKFPTSSIVLFTYAKLNDTLIIMKSLGNMTTSLKDVQRTQQIFNRHLLVSQLFLI